MHGEEVSSSESDDEFSLDEIDSILHKMDEEDESKNTNTNSKVKTKTLPKQTKIVIAQDLKDESGNVVKRKFVANFKAPQNNTIRVTKSSTPQDVTIFYMDIVNANVPNRIYLIGKVKTADGFVSCCVAIEGVQRHLFAEIREEYIEKIEEAKKELNNYVKGEMELKTKELVINSEDNQEDKENLEKKEVTGLQIETVFGNKEDKEIPES